MSAMIDVQTHETLRYEFMRRARRREEERVSQHDRERKKEQERDRSDEMLVLAGLTTMATLQQVADFNEWMDDYRAALIALHLQNEARIDEIRQQRDALLEGADVLPDGRRVVRLTDGQTVIDEFGENVSPDVIRWEDVTTSVSSGNGLRAWAEEERQLHEHNAKIDDVLERADYEQERVAQGDVTTDELDAIRGDLDAMMADLVNSQPGGSAPEPEQPDHTTNAPAQNLPTMGL